MGNLCNKKSQDPSSYYKISSEMSPQPKLSENDFEKIKLIGKGSYGSVYLVRYNKNNHIYAMKVYIKSDLREKKEKEIKNYFKISDIKKGEALLVTHDDIVFSFPACLLPRGAKLGETFSLEIKLFDKNYNNKEKEEIEQIQKKYINTENNNKEEEND